MYIVRLVGLDNVNGSWDLTQAFKALPKPILRGKLFLPLDLVPAAIGLANIPKLEELVREYLIFVSTYTVPAKSSYLPAFNRFFADTTGVLDMYNRFIITPEMRLECA